jgi:parallel beta-helix repeat protein
LVKNSSPTVKNNTITGNQYGIFIEESSDGTYQGNMISGSQYYGMYVSYSGNNPIFSGNIYSGNKFGDQYITGSITTAMNWGKIGDTVYEVGGLTISHGASLTIEPGVEVRLYGNAQIHVSGTLIAKNVTFTAINGASPWNGIYFEAGSDDSILENCVIENSHGGSVIDISGSSPTIKECTISGSSAQYGIYIENGFPVIDGCTISGIENYGVLVKNSSPTVKNNTITGNQYGIFIEESSDGTYQGNTISGNQYYGMYYSGEVTLLAINNNWGDPSGPFDASNDTATGGLYNPAGLGDGVSDNVDYDPWIGQTANSDPDNDGMPTKWEMKYFGTTSRNGIGDYDSDGLTDLQEYQKGINPTLKDTDGDGMPDDWEVKYGLNPLTNNVDADLDGDGLSNLKECQIGTNPTLKDTDGDGMPDGWEVQYSLKPLVNDASADPDKDGYTNLQEYQQGGNPNSSDSPFPWELFYPAFIGK